MKYVMLISLVLFITSCSVEDDYVPLSIEPIYMDNPTAKLFVDIIYVLPNEDYDKAMYKLNESEYLDFLNGSFFNRHDIGFDMGESKTLINEELFNLKDNRDHETNVFDTETNNVANPNRLSIFIIPRSNTYALAGIGLPQRVLITDKFLYTSTSPHEIGHSLGLTHTNVEGNIMCQIRPYLRKDFDDQQVDTMIETIIDIN